MKIQTKPSLSFQTIPLMFKTFQSLNYYLHTGLIQKQCKIPDIYSKKFVFSHSTQSDTTHELHMIKIWKTNTWFNKFIMDEFNEYSFIAILNYTITKNNIKIDCMQLNDGNLLNYSKSTLTDDEAIELKIALINHVKNIAKIKKKMKIIVDVNKNLYIFKRDYEDCGFILTNNESSNESFYLEAELDISLEM